MIWKPYSDGTSGHQGDSSKDAEKTRRPLIEIAFIDLSRAGVNGLTWREFAAQRKLHHGQASSALSNLHRSGTAQRLAERRNRCGVYVLSHHVNNRDVVPYNPNSRGRDPNFFLPRLIEAFDQEGSEVFVEMSTPKGTMRVGYSPRAAS